MTKLDLLKIIERLAKENDWSTRIVNDADPIKSFLLLQKELCELILWSDREWAVWVCTYPCMDDVFDYDVAEWFVSDEPFSNVIVELLEKKFEEVKAYNEQPVVPFVIPASCGRTTRCEAGDSRCDPAS